MFSVSIQSIVLSALCGTFAQLLNHRSGIQWCGLAWASFDPRFKNFICYSLVLDVRWKDKSGSAYERPRKQQKQHSQKRKKEQQEQLQFKVRTVCTHVLCIRGTACGVGGVLLCKARTLQPSAISCLYVWTHWPGCPARLCWAASKQKKQRAASLRLNRYGATP